MSEQNPNSTIDAEKVLPKSVPAAFKSRLKWICRFLDKHRDRITLVLTFIATFAAIWAVKSQNEVSQELANRQNFLQFYEQWESEGMQERRARLAATLLENSVPENIDDSPLVFLETLSNAEKRGLLDHEFVWTTFYVDITNYWTASEQYAKDTRIREKCSCYFEDLEALSKQLDDMARKRGQNASHDTASVRRFLELEKKRQLSEKRPDEAK